MTNTAPQAVGPDADIPANGRSVPMRPKDAATVLIIRRDTGAPRVLMGRRHRGNAFMPDKWVFPGGRIDLCDYRGAAARELADDVAAALARTAPAARAAALPRALAMAAVRETPEVSALMWLSAPDGSRYPMEESRALAASLSSETSSGESRAASGRSGR